MKVHSGSWPFHEGNYDGYSTVLGNIPDICDTVGLANRVVTPGQVEPRADRFMINIPCGISNQVKKRFISCLVLVQSILRRLMELRGKPPEFDISNLRLGHDATTNPGEMCLRRERFIKPVFQNVPVGLSRLGGEVREGKLPEESGAFNCHRPVGTTRIKHAGANSD